MFKPTIKMITKLDLSTDLIKDLIILADEAVYVGVPNTNTKRKSGQPVNNAELAYIHEHGAPENNIPAREFMQPAINQNIDKVLAQQEKSLKSVLNGQPQQVKIELNKLGLLSQSIIKNFLTSVSNGLASNKPATIKRKKSSKPLIDTSQLLNSINYVIRGSK